MLKPKTYFEQVPLEIVKKIAVKDVEQEKSAEPARRTRKGKIKEGSVGRKHGERSGNS